MNQDLGPDQAAARERAADMAQLQVAVPWMQHELRRFKISDRPRTLAQLILSLSWGEGLPAVRIPKLDYFRALTGLNNSHISTALSELELMRVITIEDGPLGKSYAINAGSGTWQATPRTDRQSVDQAVNLLREINGVPPVRSAAVNFKIGPVNLFLASGVTDSGMATRTGGFTAMKQEGAR